MTNVFGLTAAQFETFVLVMVRITAMLSLAPLFSNRQVPAPLRVALGMLFAFVVWHIVPTIRPLDGMGPLTAAIISQVVIGAAFGFVAYLVFTGVQFAGEVLDTAVGFAVVNVVNPITSQQVTILGQFELILATLLYLVTDSHHFLLQGMAGSFDLLPLPYASIGGGLEHDLVAFFSRSLYLVFQIAAPVVIALFVTNMGLALMARVAPQMNIFAIGLPIQLVVGLTMLIVSMPLLGTVLPQVFAETPRELDTVLRQLRAR